MIKRLSLTICCLALAGCATAQKPENPDLQRMLSRIDILEDEIKGQDAQIESMQDELIQVKQDCKRTTSNTAEISSIKMNKQTIIMPDISDEELAEIIKVEGVSEDQVQSALKRAGFYKGTVDGKIGPKTKEAIKAFQKSNGLTADGVIGRKTWEKLRSNL